MRRTFFGACVVALVAISSQCPASAGDAKPEPGFTALLNGKNLDGWKTKAGDSLEGKTEAFKGRFKVVDNKLVIDPKVKGDVTINTAKEFKGDVHIKFDFLPGAGCNNDLFLRGLKFDIVPKALKGVKQDEWNQFEMVIKGDTAEYKCNGQVQRTNKVKTASSPFGIRAEFGPMEIRNMRVKEGP